MHHSRSCDLYCRQKALLAPSSMRRERHACKPRATGKPASKPCLLTRILDASLIRCLIQPSLTFQVYGYPYLPQHKILVGVSQTSLSLVGGPSVAVRKCFMFSSWLPRPLETLLILQEGATLPWVQRVSLDAVLICACAVLCPSEAAKPFFVEVK